MKLIENIKKEAQKLQKELIDIRRHLHMNPELSFHEKETNAFITQKLSEEGIAYKSGYCKHGIVAEIKGHKKGGITYLRGDMDALPIKEVEGRSYGSKKDGIMHACGHDVHSTCVLGAAIILNRLKNKLSGTFRFIFQPGEEKIPGGASIMIKEGAIKNARSSKIFAQHVHPPLEVGKVGFFAGEYMASADEIYIEVEGKGGHAALPQDLVDTVLVSANILTALQSVVSRYSHPNVSTVLSFGKINSEGGATNIIPDKVRIQGTLRTMDEDNRTAVQKMIRQIAVQTAKAYGAKAKVKILKGYPTLVNDFDLTNEAMQDAQSYLGPKNVVQLKKRMTAEDFSFFSQMMPACFYRLGTGNRKKGITEGVHTPEFDIDEKALQIGAGLMAFLATRANLK